MIIDQINLNHIRIFECVFRTKSMTKAADELHMTQSGVSQHIKLLEDVLEVKLFDRIKQRLIPTSVSKELFSRCSKGLYEIEEALTTIKSNDKRFVGHIKIGMPTEFGNNIIIPLLGKFGIEHPKVTFSITYGFAMEMNHLLLEGDLDFALVDDYQLDKQIKKIGVYDEALYLCSSPDYIQKKGPIKETRKFYESLDYVDYVEENKIVEFWFKHHFNITSPEINLRATMMDVHGIARMIDTGIGVGVLPIHHIEKLHLEGKKIVALRSDSTPLVNSLSLAYVEGRTRTPTINGLIQFIKEQLSQKKP